MAEWHTYEIAAVQSVVGVIGAAVREALLYDPENPAHQTPSSWVKRGASLMAGGTLAPTSAMLIAEWLISHYPSISMINAVMLAMSVSFWIGFIGIGVAMKLLEAMANIDMVGFMKRFLPGGVAK